MNRRFRFASVLMLSLMVVGMYASAGYLGNTRQGDGERRRLLPMAY